MKNYLTAAAWTATIMVCKATGIPEIFSVYG